MKVLFVSQQFDHMGNFSGYGNLGTYLKKVAGINLIYHENRSRNRIQRKLINIKLLPHYDHKKYGWGHSYQNYFTEYEVVKQSNMIKADIIHLAYLEDTLGYISDNRNKVKAKIVATSHQPPSYWKMSNQNTEILKSLDALIVLSSEAKDYFEQFIPGKVFFIPHGIDIHFFSPQKLFSPSDKNQKCLFVGNWLRDFRALTETISLINETKNNIEFDLVYSKFIEPTHPLYSLLKYNNINWHKNIDDQSLLSLYRNASVLFLPLLSCTANNALLEAASCEVPIVTNNCGGVKNYLNEEWVYFTRNSKPEHFRDKINFILDASNSEKVRQNAELQKKLIDEKFSWETVASQMLQLYQSL